MPYLFFVFLLLFTGATPVMAQSDTESFTVSVVGAADTTPPTTPTLLTINPVAPSQIDITWSAATDDFLVSGYNVMRDGSPIATTTLLSYSDTGLTPSTTYSYAVRAFDSSFNYSSSSNSLATTTLDNVVTPTPTSTDTNKEGTIARVVLKNSRVIPGHATSTVQIETVRPSRVEIRWGRTASYELGYVVGSIYRSEHSFIITDLEPGTEYEYEVIGYTPYGHPTVLEVGSFSTLNDNPTLPPANVNFFKALSSGNDVMLSWNLPLSTNVAHVRIVRSHLGFPEYPSDGAIVYQGLKTNAVDVNILAIYSPVYYTAFVYDTSGNISSGAVALARAYSDAGEDNVNDSTKVISVVPVTIVDEATTTIDFKRVTPQMKMPQAGQIVVQQSQESLTMQDAPLFLNNNEPFTITIPADTVSGNLKSIIATIVNPTDTRESYSFLLRINKDRSAYVTTLAPFGVVGLSQLKVEIYDYEAFVVASYQTPVSFVESHTSDSVAFTDIIFDSLNVILILLGSLSLAALLALYIARLRGEDNE